MELSCVDFVLRIDAFCFQRLLICLRRGFLVVHIGAWRIFCFLFDFVFRLAFLFQRGFHVLFFVLWICAFWCVAVLYRLVVHSWSSCVVFLLKIGVFFVQS